VFAQRWTPIILRNLLVGCERFGEILAGAPGLPRSVLAQRLRTLEREGIVARSGAAYRLTACGQELGQVCLALGAWGARWRETRPEHHDPYLVVWMLSRLVPLDTLPRRRVVVRFDVPAHPPPNRYWLVVGEGEREVCVHDPGWGDGRRGDLGRRDAGRLALREAHAGPGAAGRDAGRRDAERMLDAWGRLSPFAPARS